MMGGAREHIAGARAGVPLLCGQCLLKVRDGRSGQQTRQPGGHPAAGNSSFDIRHSVFRPLRSLTVAALCVLIASGCDSSGEKIERDAIERTAEDGGRRVVFRVTPVAPVMGDRLVLTVTAVGA